MPFTGRHPRAVSVCAAPACAVLAMLLAGPVRAQLGPAPGLPRSAVGQPGGVAPLDGSGRISPLPVLPTGATAPRSLADRLGDSVSLLDFGARCDGLADDSAALAAAMATGKRIAIPAGLVCNAATVSQAGITAMLVGPGQVKTSDGSLRGPITSQIGAAPVRVGTPNIVAGFSGDLSRVPIAIEHRITGAATLGQPSSGYTYFNEVSPVYVSSYNESGWNGSTGTAGPAAGRTGYGVFSTDLTQNGQGDATAYFGSVFVAGPNKAGATSFLANPAGQLLAGVVSAGRAGGYLQGIGDVNLVDNGYDVAGIGSTINLSRTNGTGALGTTWIGYRVQSNGSATPDAAFSAQGGYRIGLDLVDAAGTQAALALGAGQRIYANATQPSGIPFPSTVQLGGEWLDFSATNGWEFVAAGQPVLSFGTGSTRFSAGPGHTNGGIVSTAIGGYSFVSGSYATALGGAHTATGTAATLMGLQAGDHGNAGATCSAAGEFAAQGDAQGCLYVLRAATAGTAARRLTADAAAAGANNCVNLTQPGLMGLEIRVSARDTAAAGAWADWKVSQAVLARDAGGTSYSGAAPTLVSAGPGAQAGLAIGADTANACLSLSFTAPNADAWHVVATVRTTESY